MVNSTLVLANKNYSSWSLRAWLVCTHSGLAFEEVVIPLRESVTHETILRHTPSGKLPVLVHGDVTVWDSLAICEYVAELFPAAGLWPAEALARARARCCSTACSAFARASCSACSASARARPTPAAALAVLVSSAVCSMRFASSLAMFYWLIARSALVCAISAA